MNNEMIQAAINEAIKQLGAEGGRAAANSMTKAQRVARARKAAAASARVRTKNAKAKKKAAAESEKGR